MFKNKFKKMTLNKDFKSSDFEIVKDSHASSIIGGCISLQSCNVFTGSCENTLAKCNSFTEKSKLMEESL